MSFVEINDKRKINEFKSLTFSKYKKSEAKKELMKCMLSNNIEDSCYWSAEFICSGDFLYLWNILFIFMSKNIHIGNPKLPIYILSRLNMFKNILNKGYNDKMLCLRNNKNVREIFIEIIGILCLSKKKNSYDIPKISENEFNIMNITQKLTAKNKKHGYKIFKNEDPREIFMAINEFSWNINIKVKDLYKAAYWLEWIIAYQKICKKKKIIMNGAKRDYPVDDKYKKNIIWIIWDILLDETKHRSQGIHKIITALMELFCLKFKESLIQKRKLLIYYAISLLTETLDTSIPIVKNTNIIENIKKNTDKIYKQIKKNEMTPDMNYLFNNESQKNLENTINKIDRFNSLTFIPRT